MTKENNGFFENYNDLVLTYYKTTTRYLEGDLVEFYGIVQCVHTYKSILGQEITIPLIEIKTMNLVNQN